MDSYLEKLDQSASGLKALIREQEFKLSALGTRLNDTLIEKAKAETEKSCRIAKWEALRTGEESDVRQKYLLSQELKELERQQKGYNKQLAAAEAKWKGAENRATACKKSYELVCESLSELVGKRGAILARLIYLKK